MLFKGPAKQNTKKELKEVMNWTSSARNRRPIDRLSTEVDIYKVSGATIRDTLIGALIPLLKKNTNSR